MVPAAAQALRLSLQRVSGANTPIPFPRPKPEPRPRPDELPDVAAAQAFEAAYRRYADRVRAICYSILEDHTEADDAASETFLAAWRHRASMPPADDEDHLRRWLFRIARHRAVDRGRGGQVRRRFFTSLDAIGEDPDGATRGHAFEPAAPALVLGDPAGAAGRVRRVLAKMPPAYAEALLLDDGAGWRLERVATFTAALDGRRVGGSAMKMRVMRARQLFARLYQQLDD